MTDAPPRLRAVPWRALDGLGPTLAPALDELLSGAPAERVLDRLLRANRHFSADQRAVTAEALFGVGLWRRRLRAHHDGTPLQLLAVLARDLGGANDAPVWLDVTLPPSTPPPTDWRDRTSLPDWLAGRLELEFPDDAPALAEALNVPGPICLRVNTARVTREALAQRFASFAISSHPGRWARDALVLDTPRPNLLGLGPELGGLFEVQDEGSQLLGELLAAQPGEQVLDLCAGAGGKALQLATHVGPRGRVHCVDLDLARLERLRTRASKADAAVLIHGREPPAALLVPRVIVDAPCSELGSLRRGPDLRWRLDATSLTTWPAVQRELLHRALHHLAPGGVLVYATCTWNRAENEAVVDALLAETPELALERPAAWPAALFDARGFLRLAPHHHGTDGFFAARLRKRPAGD